MVTRNRLNQTLRFKFTDGNASQRAIKLKTVNQNRLRDELVSGNFFEQTFISGLVENDQVVGLILDLLSRPLLLCFLSTRGRARLSSNVLLCLYTCHKYKWSFYEFPLKHYNPHFIHPSLLTMHPSIPLLCPLDP